MMDDDACVLVRFGALGTAAFAERGGSAHDSPSMTAPYLSRPVGREAYPQELAPRLT